MPMSAIKQTCYETMNYECNKMSAMKQAVKCYETSKPMSLLSIHQTSALQSCFTHGTLNNFPRFAANPHHYSKQYTSWLFGVICVCFSENSHCTLRSSLWKSNSKFSINFFKALIVYRFWSVTKMRNFVHTSM